MASPDSSVLSTTLDHLLGVTPTRLTLLARLQLHTISDLLYHFPRGYEDLSDLRTIATIMPNRPQTIQGEIVEIDSRTLNDGRFIVSVVLNDGGPTCLEGIWFNQANAARRFRFGLHVSFSGTARWYRDRWQMNNPRVQILDGPGSKATTPGIIPIYPLTEDLRLEHLRPLMAKALDLAIPHVPEIVPESLRIKNELPAIGNAFRQIHFPQSLEEARKARQRFVYEEFLVLQLALAWRRRAVRQHMAAPVLATNKAVDAHIRRLLPFALTNDQNKVIGEVVRDLGAIQPMQRLLQADVGAGKTAVAVYALLVAVANKHQAALMAPTEVLARQHFRTLERYLGHSRVRRLLLTGGLTPADRRDALEALRLGDIDLVVGTQALVQEDVQFARLGLVVVDEQHKFGVHQRARVRQLGVDPHYLVMTATPIPRTVALTVFGDLDVSVIRQMPPGRKPVTTRWVPEAERERVYEALREEMQQGRQAYLVCPLVEESAKLDVKSAIQTHATLQAGAFHGFRVGILHGRQSEEEKFKVMEEFRTKQIDLLVCTSVIEVGIDVPNATLLVIEHAERFGLAQLHQLRGRVSRGTVAGQCWLFAEPTNDESRERLKTFVRIRDGFTLAEEDVKLRGVGEFFGAKQHGLGELRFGNLVDDAELLSLARRDAFELIAQDPGLRMPENGGLRAAVIVRYGQTLELAEVG